MRHERHDTTELRPGSWSMDTAARRGLGLTVRSARRMQQDSDIRFARSYKERPGLRGCRRKFETTSALATNPRTNGPNSAATMGQPQRLSSDGGRSSTGRGPRTLQCTRGMPVRRVPGELDVRGGFVLDCASVGVGWIAPSDVSIRHLT
jgi:hypothetical protein